MKNIVVLVDFTEHAGLAFRQAANLAQKFSANFHVVHIIESASDKEKAPDKMASFLEKYATNDVHINIEFSEGELFAEADLMCKKLLADLVVLCTHGKKGVSQILFGSHIQKMVQHIGKPCLVFSENTHFYLHEVSKILVPIGSGTHLDLKLSQTEALARALGASVTLYQIDKPGTDFGKNAENIQKAREFFESLEIPCETVIEEMNALSAGFYKQTIQYALNNNFQIISLLAEAPGNELLFAIGDKENFLVNKFGVAIYTCNQ